MKKKITMKDIAKELGVSVVTVSKALGDNGGCSNSLREEILRKADELGYQYTKKVKGFSDNKYEGYTIGILVADHFFSKNAFYAELYRYIMKEAGKKNCTVIMELVQKEMEDNCVTPNIIEADKVEGIILIGEFNKEYLASIIERNIPYVVVDSYCSAFNVDAVVSDNVTGMYRLTDYLIKRGHKTFHYIGSVNATSSIMDRYIGCQKAVIANGLSQECILQIDDRNELGKIVEISLPKNLPDAFICNCDQTALYLIESLKQKGYSIPEDVSVVGFDNFMYAKLCSPQLTTYSVNMVDMAKAAISIIEKKLNNGTVLSCHIVIEGEMIVRESTK